MSQQAVKRTLGNGVTRERAREIEVEALGRLRRPRRTVLAESA
jgi:DNA-directed RNA polymerase sigma subunit (sigma70/sigma32)